MIRHPKESSWIISSVHGNNEISVWDMETGSRQLNFWACETPPLSKPTVSAYFEIEKIHTTETLRVF